jgi:hypothetical protein
MKLFSVSSSALMLVLVSLLAAAQFCQSLAPMSKMPSQKRASATRLGMAPKYIGNKWVPQTDDDLPSAGYDAVGTLLRQGPKPFLTRVFQADEWEQAVLKFMATENGGKGCDRNTAQGNMDAYLRNRTCAVL